MNTKSNTSAMQSLKEFLAFAEAEKKRFAIAIICVIITTAAMVATPYYIAKAIDGAIATKSVQNLLSIMGILSILFIVTLIAQYTQTQLMGHASQRVLLALRHAIFEKIQYVPMRFFGNTKQGDLISRINNDTERIQQFLSEGVIRFTNILFSLMAICVVMFALNVPLALTALSSCIIIALGTQLASPWVKNTNKRSLEAIGEMTAITQETLQNYKVIVAYHRQEYMQQAFRERNLENQAKSAKAQIASGIFTPIYKFAANSAQALVLLVGVYLASKGQVTAGTLIAFIAFTQRFYEPLLILASFWGNLQGALAAWSRVREILNNKVTA